MKSGSIEEITEAQKDDPRGSICHFCGHPNDLADDYGWWYFDPYGDKTGSPVCMFCWNQGYGKMHQDRYGVGDR